MGSFRRTSEVILAVHTGTAEFAMLRSPVGMRALGQRGPRRVMAVGDALRMRYKRQGRVHDLESLEFALQWPLRG